MNEIDFLHTTFENSTEDTARTSNKLPRIILVEDDQTLAKAIKFYLEKKLGLTVDYFTQPADCIAKIDEFSNNTDIPFCLITDITFEESKSDGLLLIDLFKERNLNFVSIVMTGFASIETAINATRKGVFHYLTKPFELEFLTDLVFKALSVKFGYEVKRNETAEAEKSSATNKFVGINCFKIEEPSSEDIFCGMIGRSKKMQSVFSRIEKVAASASTVLINGPSGTGKELVANALHSMSVRKDAPLVSVNCGAIPNELLESELFGHEKGAFTGAVSDRKGRFELANGGTLFLDEIGDMPLLLQVKLLRVLQNKVIERVGSSQSIPIDVRIITATHRDLEKEVMNGNFREDLFYRLNVIPLKIPALRERREDIPLLISYFLSRFVSADGRNKVEFDNEVIEILMSYDWPGNVRELENLIERLVILKGGSTITVSDLPAKFLVGRPKAIAEHLIDLPDSGIDLKDTLSMIEESLISQALERTNGNKNQASKLLLINRTTLIEKMKKKGLTL